MVFEDYEILYQFSIWPRDSNILLTLMTFANKWCTTETIHSYSRRTRKKSKIEQAYNAKFENTSLDHPLWSLFLYFYHHNGILFNIFLDITVFMKKISMHLKLVVKQISC